MIGKTNLDDLLRAMSPILMEGEFVFLSLEGARYGDYAELEPIASVLEAEGLTLVVPRSNAERCGLVYESVFRVITLEVHSGLEAVGLTAAFSGKLAEQGVSANVIAGKYHDHLLVPSSAAERAVAAIEALAGSGGSFGGDDG